MKIIGLEIENFKRIRVLRLNPDGSVCIIGGKNASGKTSCLDAIEAALGGAKHCPGEPIRRGSEDSRIVLETDAFKVTRKFTEKGTSLEVVAQDGARYPSPQGMLDDLLGTLSFDPLEFSRKRAEKQAEVVKQLVGLDFEKEDAARAEAYQKRTDVGRDLKQAQAELAAAGEAQDAPDTEVSVADTVLELERRRQVNAANEAKRKSLDELRDKAKAKLEEVAGLRQEFAEAEEEFADLDRRGRVLAAETKDLQDEDLDELTERIATAEETNRRVRANAAREKLSERTHELADVQAGLTARIEEIDGLKAAAIQGAGYPIAGMAVTDEGITLNELPFEQASSAEQLRCSVAMGLALNPKLRVLLIRDGSLLDEENLAMITKQAEEAEAQVWLERVGESDACTVILEDGIAKGTGVATEPAAEPDAPKGRKLTVADRIELAERAQSLQECYILDANENSGKPSKRVLDAIDKRTDELEVEARARMANAEQHGQQKLGV